MAERGASGMAEEPRLERRLAAILAMDVASYTRLMAFDEERTYRRLTAVMTDIVEPSIAATQGRIVKRTGDGALAEFPSVVEAVRCAFEIQSRNGAIDQSLPSDRRIRFRMGINLGDVIIQAGDIFGNGVNIAARLESIADIGGIFLSEAAARLVGGLGFTLIDLGPKELKNVPNPVRTFKIAMDGFGPAQSGDNLPSRTAPTNVLVPGFGKRPAIAVLPFRHHGDGDDAERDAFADGITEDLIAAFARWRSFPVISRNSVFALKGQNIDLRTLGQQLGVRYALGGSVRRTGRRLRTTAELVEAETNLQLFSEKYDYDIEDMFSIQDEIVRRMVGALEPELLRN